MSANDLIKLLIKLGGMVLIVISVLNASELLLALFGKSNQYTTPVIIAVTLVKFVIPAGIGVVLLNFGGLIANRLVASEPVSPSDTAYVQYLEQAVLSVLGVYLMFRSVSDAIYHAASYYQIRVLIKSGELMDDSMSPDTFGAIVSTAAEIVVALWLILGSRGLVAFTRKLRE